MSSNIHLFILFKSLYYIIKSIQHKDINVTNRKQQYTHQCMAHIKCESAKVK